MEDIVLSEILDSENSEAADLLLAYLQREHLRLTREEWPETLEKLHITQSADLTARAEALDLLLPEGSKPDREVFAMDSGAELFLTAKSLCVDLTAREWEVLYYLNGFADGIIHTRGETGEKFGVSHERILRVELKALRRSRSRMLHRQRNLRDFYQ